MKKFIRVFILIISALIAALSLAGCADDGPPENMPLKGVEVAGEEEFKAAIKATADIVAAEDSDVTIDMYLDVESSIRNLNLRLTLERDNSGDMMFDYKSTGFEGLTDISLNGRVYYHHDGTIYKNENGVFVIQPEGDSEAAQIQSFYNTLQSTTGSMLEAVPEFSSLEFSDGQYKLKQAQIGGSSVTFFAFNNGRLTAMGTEQNINALGQKAKMTTYITFKFSADFTKPVV